MPRILTRARRYLRAWRNRTRRPAMSWRLQMAVVRLSLAALVALVACAWALLCLARGDIIGGLSSAGMGALVASWFGGAMLAGPPR